MQEGRKKSRFFGQYIALSRKVLLQFSYGVRWNWISDPHRRRRPIQYLKHQCVDHRRIYGGSRSARGKSTSHTCTSTRVRLYPPISQHQRPATNERSLGRYLWSMLVRMPPYSTVASFLSKPHTTSVSETIRKPPLVKAQTALRKPKNKIRRKTIFNVADGILTPCNVASGSEMTCH